MKRLDQKLAAIRNDAYTPTDFIIADAKDGVWAGRPVSPENRVQLVGEVDRNSAGTVYLWIESLAILE